MIMTRLPLHRTTYYILPAEDYRDYITMPQLHIISSYRARIAGVQVTIRFLQKRRETVNGDENNNMINVSHSYAKIRKRCR